MKILFVTFWIPPTNSVGAVRTGKFAKFLLEEGHTLRVLAGPAVAPRSLPLEIPEALITRAALPGPGWVDTLLQRLHRRAAAAPAGPAPAAPASSQEGLRNHYYAWRHFPDRQAGWRGPALASGRRLLREFRPDLIVASAPPYTGLLVARRLAREARLPWVAELRDPWSRNPYSVFPSWRRALDIQLERRTLRPAAALVTVSPTVTAELRRRYPGKPVQTVLNGLSQEDLAPPPHRAPSDTLSIVYTGTIYVGRRDPSPLFAAIERLGSRRERVLVQFYGPNASEVIPLASRFGVAQCVAVNSPVPYRQSLSIQGGADALLLLQRNDPTDEGNIPAKVFEYLGARRPIILLGYEGGIVAEMIRARGAGLTSNDPAIIAAQLERWIDLLPAGIPPLPASAVQGLGREAQFRSYVDFLQQQAPAADRPARAGALA